jgi:sec-independent protein translocase protein TatC
LEYLNDNLEKFLPYFEDLRSRLYKGMILIVVFFVGGFLSAGVIIKKLLEFIHVEGVTITTYSPFNFADVAMDVGFFLALMVAIPYVIFSFYAFIMPALTKSEQMKLLKSIPLSIFLFVTGFAYGFFILYYSLEFLAAVNIGLGIANFWNIGQFLSQIFITAALLGLVFQFPLFLTLLVKLGIITPQTLKNKRRIAYFSLFGLSALLPPTDGISLIAMVLPLVLLYEVTIWFNIISDNKKISCLD